MPDPLASRVARRFIAEVQLDEKMKALLLKLRKGADASLSLGQLSKVLLLLGGWRVEEMVGLAQIHYDEHKHALRHPVEDYARGLYDQLKSFEVTSLPANPKLGAYYVMDLEPFESKPEWKGGQTVHGAFYNLWMGVPGYRFTDPNGKTFELLPDRHDFNRGMSIGDSERNLPKFDAKALKKSLRLYDLLPWLKKDTSYLAQINEVLGLEEHVPADKRTRENTGTCGVCFRNIKLVQKSGPPTMALHGYNRPGFGYVVGRCTGGQHPPYELSSKATEGVLKEVEAIHASHQKYLASLATVTAFDEHKWWGGMTPPKMIKKDELKPEVWEYMLKDHVKSTERQIAKSAAERAIYKWLVEHWETRELPHEGDKMLDWFTIAARAAIGRESVGAAV